MSETSEMYMKNVIGNKVYVECIAHWAFSTLSKKGQRFRTVYVSFVRTLKFAKSYIN